MADYNAAKIPTWANTNQPNIPSASLSPNGSYLIAKFNALVDAIKTDLTALSSTLQTNSDNLNALDIPGITSQLQSLADQIGVLQGTQIASSTITSLQSQITALQSAVNSVTVLQSRVAAIESRLPEVDPFWDAVTLLLDWKDGTLVDRKGHTLTAIGNAALSTAQAKFSTHSLALTGSNDCVSVATDNTSAGFAFAGDFTIEFWLYLTRIPVRGDSGVKLMTAGSQENFPWDQDSWNMKLGNHISESFHFDWQPGSYQQLAVEDFMPTANVWQFYSVTRKANRIFAHVDGNLIGASNGTGRVDAKSPLRIGTGKGTGTDSTEGFWGATRITQAARYDEIAYTVPTKAFATA